MQGFRSSDGDHHSPTFDAACVRYATAALAEDRECDGIFQPGVKFAPRTKPQVVRPD